MLPLDPNASDGRPTIFVGVIVSVIEVRVVSVMLADVDRRVMLGVLNISDEVDLDDDGSDIRDLDFLEIYVRYAPISVLNVAGLEIPEPEDFEVDILDLLDLLTDDSENGSDISDDI